MAWTRVQSAAVSSSSGTTVAVTLTGTPVTGNVCIGYGCMGSSSPVLSTVKDGNSVSMTQGPHTNGTVAGGGIFFYVVPATPSKTFTFTFSTAGSSTGMVQEFSGLSGSLDGTGSAVAGSTSPANNGAYSSTAVNELLVAYFGDEGNSINVSGPAGYTADVNNVNSSSDSNCLVYYKNSTNGSETASYTYTGTDLWIVCMVALKLSGGGAAALPLRPFVATQPVKRAGSW